MLLHVALSEEKWHEKCLGYSIQVSATKPTRTTNVDISANLFIMFFLTSSMSVYDIIIMIIIIIRMTSFYHYQTSILLLLPLGLM